MADFAGEILNFVNTGIDAGISAVSNYKQFKRSKELMNYQNELNRKNWNDLKNYQNYLNNNEFSIKMNAAKQAGLSPMAAIAGSNFNSQVGSIPSPTATAPQASVARSNLAGAYQAVAAMRQADSQSSLTDSQARLNNAQADKLESETTGIGLNNQILSETLRSHIDLTNEQNEQWKRVSSMINSNPEFLEAYAGEKYVQNQLSKSSIDLNKALTELNKALEDKAKADVIKAKEETLLVQANRYLTNAQKEVLLDQNFRENHRSVPFLLEAIDKVYKDPYMPDSVKAQKISILNSALEDCSNVSAYGRELKKIKAQEESNTNVETLRGANAVENTKEFGRQNRQTNREQVEIDLYRRLINMPLDRLEKYLDRKQFKKDYPNSRPVFKDGVRIPRSNTSSRNNGPFSRDYSWKFFQDGWTGY